MPMGLPSSLRQLPYGCEGITPPFHLFPVAHHDKGRYRQHRSQSRGPTLLKLAASAVFWDTSPACRLLDSKKRLDLLNKFPPADFEPAPTCPPDSEVAMKSPHSQPSVE